MKKIFAQPEMMVVKLHENDIIATSTKNIKFGTGTQDGGSACAPGERGLDFDSWYEGY